MSHWKRLGNVTKGILKEALSNSDDVELTEEELLDRLDRIRSTEADVTSAPPAPRNITEDDIDDNEDSEDTQSAPPPTRKPL